MHLSSVYPHCSPSNSPITDSLPSSETKLDLTPTDPRTMKEKAELFCFFCAMAEPDRSLRRTAVAKCFKEMPLRDDHEQVLVLSSLWKFAMRDPNNPELPSLGIFSCMAKLILKGINGPDWLLRDQNIYIPYYAAHIIGSYTINHPKFAQIAVDSGVIVPLVELLRGKLSWVETRVAIRALDHLSRHKNIFSALLEYENEIVELAMKIASTCLELVYREFVSKKGGERKVYHSDLMTRGVGGLEYENRKAEEWASQLQCWSISLLDRFARKERCINLISNPKFLRGLGGLANNSSPAGLRLIRTLCKMKTGRIAVADTKQAIESLCNMSRSSDDWRSTAIQSLLMILKDPDSRYKAIEISAPFLRDLVELRTAEGRKKIGEVITQTLLQDFSKIKYGQLSLKSGRAQRALEEVWDLKVDRRKRERLLSEEEIEERKALSSKLKRQGNELFWAGEIERAMSKYTKALESCPLKYRNERVVLHSNRAQCCLALGDPEGAISDATRALSLCSLHGKSLWRRSQAYDMKGMAKESLMDCLTFLDVYRKSRKDGRGQRVPYPVKRMIRKQMDATWIFSDALGGRLGSK